VEWRCCQHCGRLNMLRSSSLSLPRGAEVSLSHQPREVGATRLWARAHVRWLPPPERTNGRPAPVQRLAERALPSRRGPCLIQPILRGGRRSGRRLHASSTMARIAPTLTPCRGAGLGEDHQTRRRRRVRHCWWSRHPHGACSRYSSGAGSPGCSRVPRRRREPQPSPSRSAGRGISPRGHGGECCRCRGSWSKRSSARDGGLEKCRS
jgi:hypothetical protein